MSRPSRHGSSPLARGLHGGFWHEHCADRIIPARAGSTSDQLDKMKAAKDHPRSRGVYCRRGTRMISVRGSSPLARGLPQSSASSSPLTVDHPRSRGVYFAQKRPNVASQGSSPLARGLHWQMKETYLYGPDHPRSRGVYSWSDWRKSSQIGSSPLARGLRLYMGVMNAEWRIIPARAGSTTCRPSP